MDASGKGPTDLFPPNTVESARGNDIGLVRGGVVFCRNCGAALADQSPFCESCGSPTGAGRAVVREGPLRSATEQVGKARVGSRIRPNAVIIGALVVVGLLLLWALSNNESPSPATTVRNEAVRNDESTPTEKTPQTDSSIPPLQKSFTSMIESFIPKYNSAGSEVLAANDEFRHVEQEHRKANVRVERKTAIANYFSGLGSLQFQGWVGLVVNISPFEDLDETESAYLSVKLLGTDIVLETANGSKVLDAMTLREAAKDNDADLFTPSANTMISRSDVLYQSLLNLKKGDEVTVSGTFILKNYGISGFRPREDTDYLYEASATEKGSMTEPEFFVKFSRISKGVQSLEKPAAAQSVTPAVSQESYPPTVVDHVTPPASDTEPAQPHAATCEVVNAKGCSCVIESHSSITDASAGEDWTITIINPSFAPAVFTARIELQDDAGVIVAAASWGDLSVGGYGRYVFTGRLQHDNKLTFARVIAKLEANRK